jgi:hypothetical protein
VTPLSRLGRQPGLLTGLGVAAPSPFPFRRVNLVHATEGTAEHALGSCCRQAFLHEPFVCVLNRMHCAWFFNDLGLARVAHIWQEQLSTGDGWSRCEPELSNRHAPLPGRPGLIHRRTVALQASGP